MAGAGTGQPICFICIMCRSTLVSEERRRNKWKPTGKTLELTRQQKGTGGSRVAQRRYEYECECGHKGWSRHMDVERAYHQLMKEQSEMRSTKNG